MVQTKGVDVLLKRKHSLAGLIMMIRVTLLALPACGESTEVRMSLCSFFHF
ncbi:hypothetical protein C8R32_102165 [Nitrosospira sp. Nsp5]|uniref:Uncharacterized protein n=1 Tax=Nitrosospira multiformis TaxID=1231 RepID=A0ABY0TKJ1_9PROT|nr:hypothetical protein C8R32_102165 [Nitrosospira sp. Nsp5]SDQ97964.1 hypothetical protein SAMN05216402_3093 [Nitrosospira multiformis]